jgi:hypothetical protein
VSRHQATTLEAKRPADAGAPRSRSGRRKRGILRRTGIVLPAAAIAAVAVAAVTIAADLVSSSGSGASSLAEALDQLPRSKSIGLLEQERQQIIVMDAAVSTMSVAAKPVAVSPAKVEQQAAAQAAEQEQAQQQSTAVAAAPDPGTAQAYAYQELPAYGFSQATQWSCLDSLWQQESGWQYDAENPSGAYGIPQALPASKMASAGSDYLTDPDTQIRWGLGYISQVYGTPCAAWAHEVSYGWY